LQNVVRYAVIQAVADVITPDCLPGSATGKSPATPLAPLSLNELREMVRTLLAAGTADLYRRIIHDVDRVVLDEVLHHVGGNQMHASELLGISRTTLRAKLAARSNE
jgi:two-component system nitrogen regulation response regulator GlnG